MALHIDFSDAQKNPHQGDADKTLDNEHTITKLQIAK